MAEKLLRQWQMLWINMNKLIIAFVGIAALCVFGACQGKIQNADGPQLAVSIEPQRQILQELAGTSYKVNTVLSRGANPETYDPSTSERLLVDNADIYFTTGVLPFESKLESSTNARVVDTSKGVDFIYGTHNHAHEHGVACDHDDHETPDPHYWTSVSGVRAMASNMAAALVQLMPDSADVINRRLDTFNAGLDSLKNHLDSLLLPHRGETFAVWHPSLSYLARDYGLEQLALGQEGKEMSALSLSRAIDRARADSVKVFFFQQEYDSRQAEPLCRGIGARHVTINPLAFDWKGQLMLVADEIAGP